ncbi:MAG: 4Fe-4S binding protein [Bacteroidales bacterium]|nr:4Fe-4S binding protein [Bacteroidales bacterium]
MSYFVQPVVLLLNNLLASLLGRFDIYSIYHVDIKPFQLAAYIVPSAFLLLVGVLSLSHGRLYCNTVCPVGTLLGLLSKVSLFRIRFDEDKCTRCGRCAMACKSSCIDFLNKNVDLSQMRKLF